MVLSATLAFICVRTLAVGGMYFAKSALTLASTTLPSLSILLTVSFSTCPGFNRISPGTICSATALEFAGFAAAPGMTASGVSPPALPKQYNFFIV